MQQRYGLCKSAQVDSANSQERDVATVGQIMAVRET